MDAEAERDFTRFVQQRAGALLRVAHALTGDQHAAEDLVQSALAKAMVRWGQIGDSPEGYVRRIVFHEFVSGWRRRRRRPETPVAVVPEVAGADVAEASGLRLVLRAALVGLPPRQRAVIVLRYLEDRSEREVAEILGCRAGTVASQASRALAKLRTVLADAGAEASR